MNRAATPPDGSAPWAGLETTVPADRDHEAVVRLVECVLVELTHASVGAVVISRRATRTAHTQYVAVDAVGERFRKIHFDDRAHYHATTLSRETVRNELITRLTRSPAAPVERARKGSASEPDTFVVKPVRELQTP